MRKIKKTLIALLALIVLTGCQSTFTYQAVHIGNTTHKEVQFDDGL